MNVALLLVCIVFIAGCAFKVPQEGALSGTAAPAVVQAPKGAAQVVGEALFSFPNGARMAERKRPMIRDGGVARPTSPVILPVKLPESIHVQLRAVFDSGETENITAVVLLKQGVSVAPPITPNIQNLRVESNAQELTVTFELLDLPQQLKSDEETQVTLTIELAAKGKKIGGFEVSFSTPPSRLELADLNDDQAVRARPDLGEVIRLTREEGLSSGNMKLSLLRLVSIKNLSSAPVGLAAATKLLGTVWQQLDSYRPQQNGCRWDQGETHTSDVLSDDVYLIPVSPEIQTTFYKTVADSRRTNEQHLSFDAGGLRLMGIFAQGARIASRPRSRSNAINVSTCYPRCVRGPQTIPGINDACLRCFGGDFRPCEECRRLSDEHPAWQLCEAWGVGFAGLTLNSGTQASTYVDLDSSAISGRIRFESEIAEDVEDREISILRNRYQVE